MGKTLAESNLRKLTGLSVIGIWKRGQMRSPALGLPSTRTQFWYCQSAQQLRKYDELMVSITSAPPP